MASNDLVTGVDLPTALRLRHPDAHICERDLNCSGNVYTIRLADEREVCLELSVVKDVACAEELFDRHVDGVTIGGSPEEHSIGDDLCVWRVEPPEMGTLLFRRDNVVISLSGDPPLDELLSWARWLDDILTGPGTGVRRGAVVQPPKLSKCDWPDSISPGQRVEVDVEVSGAEPPGLLVAGLVEHVIIQDKPKLLLVYYAPTDKREDTFGVMMSNRQNVVGIAELTVKLQ
ncbi:MAG: hypothetical protein PVJ57_04665 [Phycisphaerae bacterium]|jgi:hypothetical protein